MPGKAGRGPWGTDAVWRISADFGKFAPVGAVTDDGRY